VTPVSLKARLEYVAFRVAASELLKLPPAAAFRAAEGAGRLACRVLGRRSRIARENIRAAFPALSPADAERLVRDSFRNTFRLAGEVLYLRRLVTESNWRDYIEIENGERALDVFLEGRGGILVSGHLGNWELLAHVLPLAGLPSQVLVRPLDNPLLERYILGVRDSSRRGVIMKAGAGASCGSGRRKKGRVCSVSGPACQYVANAGASVDEDGRTHIARLLHSQG
jgi:KDO2-lipid IV(A) lauroyltransferase